MIDSTQNNAATLQAGPSGSKPHKVLKMVKNERMGGFVPVWENAKTAREKAEGTLSMAQHGQDANIIEAGLAYNPQDIPLHRQEFGFGDLVDMVNPMHHIPVVGHIYREITGDQIKPISQIIGGAAFGGGAGAAVGLVNAAVKEETGRDIGENAMALALNGEMPEFRRSVHTENPEQRLNEAAKTAEATPQSATYADLPGSLLAFADLGGRHNGVTIERLSENEDIAWNTSRQKPYPHEKLETLGIREPITKFSMKSMPKNRYNG